MFRHTLQGLLTHLPSQCAVCGSWPSQAVCSACVDQFAQPQSRCRTCALPLTGTASQCGACLQAPPLFDQCLAAVPYAYPWTDLVVAFKFQKYPAWARSFALLMRSAPWVEPALDQADLLIPLPLSDRRLQWRGYNQAQILAQALDADKTRSGLLLRIRDTPPQSSLPRSERLASVRDAFAVDPLKVDQVQGQSVVLVDDVMTSGASLAAAAKVLRHAGAARITALVFARTE